MPTAPCEAVTATATTTERRVLLVPYERAAELGARSWLVRVEQPTASGPAVDVRVVTGRWGSAGDAHFTVAAGSDAAVLVAADGDTEVWITLRAGASPIAVEVGCTPVAIAVPSEAPAHYVGVATASGTDLSGESVGTIPRRHNRLLVLAKTSTTQSDAVVEVGLSSDEYRLATLGLGNPYIGGATATGADAANVVVGSIGKDVDRLELQAHNVTGGATPAVTFFGTEPLGSYEVELAQLNPTADPFGARELVEVVPGSYSALRYSTLGIGAMHSVTVRAYGRPADQGGSVPLTGKNRSAVVPIAPGSYGDLQVTTTNVDGAETVTITAYSWREN